LVSGSEKMKSDWYRELLEFGTCSMGQNPPSECDLSKYGPASTANSVDAGAQGALEDTMKIDGSGRAGLRLRQ
jgi:hypothetical protein